MQATENGKWVLYEEHAQYMAGVETSRDMSVKSLEGSEEKRLRAALEMIYDRWEKGTTCYEDVENEAGCLGNAVKLSFEEEQEILNLIVDKAEEFEQACANCGKPYRAHLIHDGNKCHPGKDSGWFPKSVADAISGVQR
jgi:hypothetical protein